MSDGDFYASRLGERIERRILDRKSSSDKTNSINYPANSGDLCTSNTIYLIKNVLATKNF